LLILLLAGGTALANEGTWRASEERVRRTSELVGKDVQNWQGDYLGQVEEVVVNPQQGRVTYLAVRTDQIDDTKMVPVPFEEVNLAPDENYLIVDAKVDDFARAEGFEKDEWPPYPDYDWMIHRERRTPGRAGTTAPRSYTWTDEQRTRREARMGGAYTGRQGEHMKQAQQRQQRFREPYGEETPTEASLRGDEQRVGKEQRPLDNAFAEWNTRVYEAGPGGFGWSHKATELTGKQVASQEGNQIGQLEDLAIDMREGRIAYAVVDLQDGDMTAIPWRKVDVDSQDRQLTANVKQKHLERAPKFRKGESPDMEERRWASETHAAYETEPYTVTHGYETREAAGRGDAWYWSEAYGMQPTGEMKQRETRKIKGKVKQTYRTALRPGMSDTLILVVDTDRGQQERVSLGPEWYITAQPLDFQEGENVELDAYMTTVGDEDIPLATTVTVAGDEIVLIDPEEGPAWTGMQQDKQAQQKQQKQQKQRQQREY
jgi:sporulation protein YlmC with PRC-barrel domain